MCKASCSKIIESLYFKRGTRNSRRFSAWASGSDAPRLGHHNPHPPHPHPSPHIDSSPAPSSAVHSSSPFFLSHLSVFLTTRKMTLLYFLTSTNASSPCVQWLLFLCLLSRFSLYPLVFPFYDGPGSGFLHIYPVWHLLRFLNESMCLSLNLEYICSRLQIFLLHCSVSSLETLIKHMLGILRSQISEVPFFFVCFFLSVLKIE